MDVILWAGPVFGSTLESISWPRPTRVIVLNQGVNGIGSDAFKQLGESLGPNPIETILAENGIDNPGIIGILGYSAFHGLANYILTSADAGRVNILGAFDAYFVSSEVPVENTVKRGYEQFCQRAVNGEAVAVITTSSNGDPPGNVAFSVLADRLGLQPSAPPAGVPPPVEMRSRGNCYWADYQQLFSHPDHANALAVPWTNSVIVPYLQGGGVGSSDGVKAVFVLLAAAVGTYVYINRNRFFR